MILSDVYDSEMIDDGLKWKNDTDAVSDFDFDCTTVNDLTVTIFWLSAAYGYDLVLPHSTMVTGQPY